PLSGSKETFIQLMLLFTVTNSNSHVNIIWVQNKKYKNHSTTSASSNTMILQELHLRTPYSSSP
ncbi:hypothetical protein, partial [Salmonella sp. gx-f7]|uniref:hypothetical protein n=1 Tax=Salmonella sp. gx-f7 TaxID=2582606 RepID=UPI001F42970D